MAPAPSPAASPEFPIRTISIGICTMIVLLIASSALSWGLGNQIRAAMEGHVKVVSAAEKVDHYGRVLEMSIKAVIRHGDIEAAAEYRRVQPRLRALLADLRGELRGEQSEADAAEVDEADQKLIAMEYEALDLVSRGQMGSARKLIESRRYDYLVDVYYQGIMRIETSAARYAESMRWQLSFNVWLIVGLSAASLVLVILGWAALILPTRRWGAQLERARLETEQASMLLEQKQAELEDVNDQLFRQARTDTLTGLGTRLKFNEDIAQLWPKLERDEAVASLMICDIDFFKQYNDTFGHLLGDEVLRQVAAALQGARRSGDRIYRMGGEEFLVLLDGCVPQEAASCAERYRRAVEALGIPHSASPLGKVTVSAGVAALAPGGAANLQGWLSQADEAMYEAKSRGRNTVVASLRLAA